MNLSSLKASLLLLYSSNIPAAQRVDFPDSIPLGYLALDPCAPKDGERRYRGQLTEGVDVELTCALAYDTYIMRLNLIMGGDHPASDWLVLRKHLDDLLGKIIEAAGKPKPWAATILYTAVLPVRKKQPDLQKSTMDLFAALGNFDISQKPDPTAFGWLWCVSEDKKRYQGHVVWQRTLTLLIPGDRVDKVDHYFLDPVVQGFARIELYLQKAKQHSRQYDLVQPQLEESSEYLQVEMAQALETADFSQLHLEQKELERISQQLMKFLAQKAALEVLLNSLRNLRDALVDHLNRVRLQADSYNQELQHLTRHIEQLESDLNNARIIQESTYVFQDIQRGVEANRLERASFLMGSTAALLAGIAIFNSFLDIWNLALEGSNLIRPESWIRIILGALAGGSLPLGATWAVERRRGRAIVAFLIGLIAVAAAFISTILVNLN